MPGRRPTRARGLTREERDERNAQIVTMHNRGRSMWDIGKRFSISGVAVSKILKGIRLQWQETQVSNYDEYVLQRREEYRYVREQAMRGWFRSLKDAEKLVEEMGIVTAEDGEMAESDVLRLVKKTTTSEGQSGNNAFLVTVLKAYRDEAELLGYVKNVTVSQTTSVAQVGNLQDVLDAPVDPVEARMQGAVEMPNKPIGE